MRHTGNRFGRSNLPLFAILFNHDNNLAASASAAELTCELLLLG